MGVLDKWLYALKNIQRIAEDVLDTTLYVNRQIIADTQRERISEGIGNNDLPIQRTDGAYYPYAQSYVRYKRTKGGRTDVIDLKLTGEFHRKIEAVRTGRLQYTIFSRDKKNDELQNKYTGVLGVSEQDMKKIINSIDIVYKYNLAQKIKRL